MKRETDIEAVRNTMRLLLDLDLAETDMSPMVMQHPFTNSAFVAIAGSDGKQEMINLLDDGNMQRWRKYMEKQLERLDVRQIFYMALNKPYYLTALKLVKDDLSVEDFSALLAHCWISGA